jgi:FtsP/CotA-like multicopper oxidase with cupredoxin domain
MTIDVRPYVVPEPINFDPAAAFLETAIIAAHAMVDLGGGLMAHAETYNGAIPGPTLRLNVGDTAIVRLVNELDHPSGIHWHGIMLANSADGTEVTQDGVVPAFPLDSIGVAAQGSSWKTVRWTPRRTTLTASPA